METRTHEHVFAKFIEKFRDQIKENFLEDASRKRGLLSQHPMGVSMQMELADSILSDFARNIGRSTEVETIADAYIRLGIRCVDEGVSFAEMVRVLILLKRHIWLFFQESNFAGQPFDVRSIVAMNNRTALFFDRAIYHFLVGYEQSATDEASELQKIYDTLLEKLRQDLAARLAKKRDD